MFGLNSLNSLFCYNGPLWTIMDHNRVVLAIMEKSVFPDVIDLFHCVFVIGPFASPVSDFLFLDTPARMFSRRLLNQLSQVLNQNPTFNPEVTQD